MPKMSRLRKTKGLIFDDGREILLARFRNACNFVILVLWIERGRIVRMPDSLSSKRALAEALKRLMAKQSLEKITVGDICNACGMSRKGFYYHFRDKYDLVNWIFYSEFVVGLYERPEDNVWMFYENICTYFSENRSFYLNAFAIQGQNSFSDYFCEIIHPLARARLKATFGEGADHDFYATFFTDAFRASLERWLREQSDIPPHEFVRLIKRAALALGREYEQGLSKDCRE